MKRTALRFGLSVAVTAVVTACGGDVAAPCAPTTADDRYAIYGAVLRDVFAIHEGDRILLRRGTLFGGELARIEDDDREHVVMRSMDARIPEEILADGASTYAIDVGRLDVDGAEVVSLALNEIPPRVSREAPDPWDVLWTFHEPTLRAVFALSPVGACEGDALVYVERQCSRTCTSVGHYVVLVHDGGTWRVQASTEVWVW